MDGEHSAGLPFNNPFLGRSNRNQEANRAADFLLESCFPNLARDQMITTLG